MSQLCAFYVVDTLCLRFFLLETNIYFFFYVQIYDIIEDNHSVFWPIDLAVVD